MYRTVIGNWRITIFYPHRRLNESSRWLKASQCPKQEGTSQHASVVTSCFISLLHATGKTEISTTILRWWNGAPTCSPQPFVWKSRTRRWKLLLQSQLVSTMHCNNRARELPWKLFMRHPSVRSSSKIEACKEWVTHKQITVGHAKHPGGSASSTSTCHQGAWTHWRASEV